MWAQGSRNDVYFHREPESPSPTTETGFWHQDDDGSYSYWEIAEDGEFYHQDPSGMFWAWSEWEDMTLAASLTPEQQKEVDEAYSLAEAKARTFTQARQAVRARNLTRGFYPFSPGGKGKSKGRGKSKGKGKGKPFVPRPSAPAVMAATSEVYAQPGDPNYSGCFVCGSREHSWRECPKRSSSSKGKGKRDGTNVLGRERFHGL